MCASLTELIGKMVYESHNRRVTCLAANLEIQEAFLKKRALANRPIACHNRWLIWRFAPQSAILNQAVHQINNPGKRQ